MLCEECKSREATTYVKTVINGKVTEKHLCSKCAAKSEFAAAFDFSSPLSGMLTSIFGDTVAIGDTSAGKRCECCGSDFNDIVNSGKLGCAGCYETFYDELLPYLKRIHGGVKHIGKIAYTTEETQGGGQAADGKKEESPADTLQSLKNELKKLISEENFEQAAVIRDKIKELGEGEK